MNTSYLRLELRRFFRNRTDLFFIAVLPAFFYVTFGAVQEYGEVSLGGGNVALYILVSMAAYGAVTATVGVGGMAAVERMQGWGRQLGLTPLSDWGFVAVKAALATLVACVPITLIVLIGVATGAEGTFATWALAIGAVLVGACVFALFGLCAGLAFRTEAAVSAASGMVVILAFLGNVFIPLSGVMLAIAKFTPLYGVVSLARHPVSGGAGFDGAGRVVTEDPLWVPLLNLGVWAVALAVLAVWLVRRGRGRQ